MGLQQSPLYLTYIQKLGWKQGFIDGVVMIYRHIFLLGGLAKIQRCEKLPDVHSLISALQKNKIRTLALEPSPHVSQEALDVFCEKLIDSVNINTSPFLPTKTIMVDLSAPEDVIFQRFSEAKRRAVRRAQKNSVSVVESQDIRAMSRIKSKSAGLLGSITTYGLKELWETFGPENASILLAHHKTEQVGGVFLLFWEKTAYYWIVGAIREGKKLFTPTLLVWEALKLSKKRGNKTFDFVGVWDERLPNQNKEWIGFTKFKEGFGGKEIYYPFAR